MKPDERPDRPVPWGLREVIISVVIAGLAVLLLSLGIAGLHELWGTGLGALTVVSIIVLGVVLVGTALLLGPLRHKGSLKTLGLGLYASRLNLLLALMVFGGSLAFNLLYAQIVTALGWEGLLPPDVVEEIGLEGSMYVVGAFAIVLIGPFSEEVFFRAFLFPGLAGRLGWIGAGAVSAALFALSHGSFGVMIPAFFTGGLLAWLYWRTGSLWPCLLAHAAQNAVALAASGL
jgi:membrane protease YdiL (CAAX protease family)